MKSFPRVLALAQFAAMILAVGLISACQSNPLSAAQSPDQKAYALYGTFVVFEEQAAVLVRSPSTPAEVKSAIRKADAVAKPVVDNLLGAARQYVSIQMQLKSGATSADRLQIATANLQKWVADATPLINSLVSAVGGK
jgi:hypothetical protein